MKKKSSASSGILRTGAVVHNPVLIEAVGLAPILAVATSSKAAVLLAVLTSLTLLIAEAMTATVLRKFSYPIRMLMYFIVGTVITVISMAVTEVFFTSLSIELGLFMPLTAVNSFIALHCERYASSGGELKATMKRSAASAAGYSAVALTVGIIRELFSSGSIFGAEIIKAVPSSGYKLPFFALILCGFFAAALKTRLGERYQTENADKAFMEHSVLTESDNHELVMIHTGEEKIRNRREEMLKRKQEKLLEKEKAAAEKERLRIEAENAEKERLRIEAENAEKERLRFEAENAEKERIRIEAENAEKERLRIEAENAEKERVTAEERRLKQERIAAEEALHREQYEKVKAEADRLNALRAQLEEINRAELEKKARLKEKSATAKTADTSENNVNKATFTASKKPVFSANDTAVQSEKTEGIPKEKPKEKKSGGNPFVMPLSDDADFRRIEQRKQEGKKRK